MKKRNIQKEYWIVFLFTAICLLISYFSDGTILKIFLVLGTFGAIVQLSLFIELHTFNKKKKRKNKKRKEG